MMNQDQYHSAQSDKVFYVNDAKFTGLSVVRGR